MPVPADQTLMVRRLRFAADDNHLTRCEVIDIHAAEFQLTPAERNELLTSGQQAVLNNRAGRANFRFKKAGLLREGKVGL